MNERIVGSARLRYSSIFRSQGVASLWTPSVSCTPSRYALRLKIVTDVSPFLFRSFTYLHIFVGWAMMTIRCIASILIIVCPCDDGGYAEFSRYAQGSANCAIATFSAAFDCASSCTSNRVISRSTFALISLWTTMSALSLMDARFAWISFVASRSARALHSSKTAYVV